MESLSNSVFLEFETMNTDRHKDAKPPQQAYLYFPSEMEIVQFDNGNSKKLLRRIFEGGVLFNSFETEHLNQFNLFLKKKNFTLPDNWETFNTLRFLLAYSFDYEKALKFILDHIDWRSKFLPVSPSDTVKKLLNIGFVYVHGRDNRFRPIVMLNPDIFINNLDKYSLDDWILTIIYLFEYIKENCFLPGQIENWNILCDVSKTSVIFMPNELKVILNVLQSNYRCRLNTMYIINVSFLIKILWKTISLVLDTFTLKKIKLLKGESDIEGEVFKIINKTQIESKFGGLACNIEKKFFPPIFPSLEYFVSEEDKNILVSQQKYIEIINTNHCLKKSPYIENKKENNDNINILDIEKNKGVTTDYCEKAKSHDVSVRRESNNISRYEDCSIKEYKIIESIPNEITDLTETENNKQSIFAKNIGKENSDNIVKTQVINKGEDIIQISKSILNIEKFTSIPEGIPSKGKVESSSFQDESLIGTRPLEDFQNREIQPKNKKFLKQKENFTLTPDSINNSKNVDSLKISNNKLDISTENKTKPDDLGNTHQILLTNGYQSKILKDEGWDIKMEKEEPTSSCCNYLGKSKTKCTIF